MLSTNDFYFLKLRQVYRHCPNHQEIPVSSQELAGIFVCTPRNVKLIVNKLVEDGLLDFMPGIGRGNTSKLIFYREFDAFLLQKTEMLLNERAISEALELVKEFGDGTEADRFLVGWVNSFFGYKKLQAPHQEVKDALVIPIYRTITTLDPTRVIFDSDAHLIMQAFDTLVKYDADREAFSGALAHAWETNGSYSEWLFHLRKGVVFHNGRPLTAEAVKQSFTRLFDSPHRWVVDDIDVMEVKSRHALLFRLKRPNALFLHFVAFTPASVVDTSGISDGFVRFSVGTGPFVLEKITPDHCILSAFDAYFGYRPHLDRIEVVRVSEYFKESLDGSGQLFMNLGEGQLPPFPSRLGQSEARYSGTNVLTLNMRKKGPLQNKSFRRVIDRMIDREALLALGGIRHEIACGFPFSETAGRARNVNANTLSSAADWEQELRDAGYLGETLVLTTYHRHEPDAACIRETLLRYGVRIQLQILDWAAVPNPEILRRTDMLLFEATPHEGVISMFDLFLFEWGFIYPFLDPEHRHRLEDYVNRLKNEENPAARFREYREMEQYFADEGAMLFLVHKIIDITYDSSLEGVAFTSRGWADFRELWYRHEQVQSEQT